MTEKRVTVLPKPTLTIASGPAVTDPTRRQVRLGTFCALTCALLVLAGCGSESQPPRAPSPAPTAAHRAMATPARPAPVPSPTLGAVTWATAVDPITGAPADSINEYPPDAAQLIAAIPASALPAGATIDAAWFYNDTSLDAFNTRVALPDGAARRWVDLHLSRKDDTPWPDGTYEVVVSLNGVEVQRSSVSVVSGN